MVKNKKIFKTKTQLASGIIIFVLTIILARFIYDSYHVYRKTIVGQQQQQLITIAKSLERSLKMYFSDKIGNLAIIEESNGVYKEILKELAEDGQEKFQRSINSIYKELDLIGIYMVDPQGKVRFKSTLSGEDENYLQKEEDFSEGAILSQDQIRQAYIYKDKGFIMPLIQPIYEEKEYLGAFVGFISLDAVYNKLISPIKVGEQGYVMIKDCSGSIIMHPVKEQIGIDIVADRKKKFPEFYFGDLEKLEANQYAEDEGVAEYYSYWWHQTPPTKVKKISSFCSIDLGGTFWILAVVMDYSEIVGPIQNNFMRLLILSLMVCLIVIATSIIYIRLKKKQEDLMVETEYLKNINYTLKELQASEKKVMHYQKLQTIDTLTGGIAHELNNLLTPILGYSQLASCTMTHEHEYYDDMKEICDAALKAKELVQQISLLSREEKLEGKNNSIDISEEILKSLKMLKVVKEDHIKIIEEIQVGCGYIQGSAAHIQQILINLCNNACQSMKEEGGTITIKLEQIDPKQNKKKYARLVVSDTGCGIREDLIDRIFDPFFTTKEIGKGTGIGLSIVKSMVKKYKGKIRVESEEDKGSCFEVLLPITETKPVEIKKNNIKATLEKKLKILLVEDNVQVIRFLKKSLVNRGYEVEMQTNPLEALENFKKSPQEYNLVITDYAMPYLTGTKLISEMKEIRTDIKIILITGVIEAEVVDQIKKDMIDDFIIKPVEYKDLFKKIDQLFL